MASRYLKNLPAKLNQLISFQFDHVVYRQVPEIDYSEYVYDMNIYHDALLCWSFRKALQAIHLPNALSYYQLFQTSDTSEHAGKLNFGRSQTYFTKIHFHQK